MKIKKALIVSLLSISSLILSSAIPSQVEAGSSPNREHSLIAAAHKDDTIKSGEFKSLDKRTDGDVEIVRADNGRLYVVLGASQFCQNRKTYERGAIAKSVPFY